MPSSRKWLPSSRAAAANRSGSIVPGPFGPSRGWSAYLPYRIGIYRFGHGIVADLWTTRYSDMKNIRLALPDLATQQDIAALLDAETVRIDALIEKKERLVAGLEEKHGVLAEALISGRTYGERAASRSRSGLVHFLPAGWTETRLRFGIRRIEQGWSPQCEDRQVEGDAWGVLKLGAITTGVFREGAHKALPPDLGPIPAYAVHSGDVLIARASGSPALVGKACLVHRVTHNLMISDKHYRVRLDDRLGATKKDVVSLMLSSW
jgi:type I restriction enzyme, S subunit